MKSSFARRRGTPGAGDRTASLPGQAICPACIVAKKTVFLGADLGTRPGPFGQTLVSAGQADVDRLLGGGVPLGTLLLILEDGWSPHHTTLLRYFLAEGAACDQVDTAAAPARRMPCSACTHKTRAAHTAHAPIAAELDAYLCP
jgi:hypothetical protein